MIFRKDIASNQEIQFDKAKMLDNYQQYEDDLNFKLKALNIIISQIKYLIISNPLTLVPLK